MHMTHVIEEPPSSALGEGDIESRVSISGIQMKRVDDNSPYSYRPEWGL